MSEFYAAAGRLTALTAAQLPALHGLPKAPSGICAAVAGLVVHPMEAPADLDGRAGDKQIRPMDRSLATLLARNGSPLSLARPVEDRLVATCRHFATLAAALLRARGIPARARCGFATYFRPGKAVDHWVTEYFDGRWVRTDPQVGHGAELTEGAFLTGGEAWLRWRAGDVDPADFGVGGHPTNWGIGEIRGNLIRDFAALYKVEMLPWDEWGRMPDSYAGRTGPEYDELMDRVAAVCAEADPHAVTALYATEDLAVPDLLLH